MPVEPEPKTKTTKELLDNLPEIPHVGNYSRKDIGTLHIPYKPRRHTEEGKEEETKEEKKTQ